MKIYVKSKLSKFSNKSHEKIDFLNLTQNALYEPSISTNSELTEISSLNEGNSTSSFIKNFSVDSSMSLIEGNDEISLHDIYSQNRGKNKPKEKKEDYFKVLRNNDGSLFPKSNICISSDSSENMFLGRKRSKTKRVRKDNADNIRKKVIRTFYNKALNKALNNKLKHYRSNQYFEIFPTFFASDVDKKRKSKIINMTLKEIFEKEELYFKENEKGKQNYLHNLKVVQNENIKKNKEFQAILNKTFNELYQEYLISDEFLIKEINRLKKKKMSDDYIQSYKMIARTLIEFFSSGIEE